MSIEHDYRKVAGEKIRRKADEKREGGFGVLRNPEASVKEKQEALERITNQSQIYRLSNDERPYIFLLSHAARREAGLTISQDKLSKLYQEVKSEGFAAHVVSYENFYKHRGRVPSNTYIAAMADHDEIVKLLSSAGKFQQLRSFGPIVKLLTEKEIRDILAARYSNEDERGVASRPGLDLKIEGDSNLL